VANARATYQNGSRWGSSGTTGYSGDVFEPIDEFKGDVARAMLYFAVRYEANFDDNSWDDFNNTNDPRNGTRDQFYEQWFIDLLLDWHALDPVDQKEINRNNAIFNFQGNRNPFVDNPAYADDIWNPTASLASLESIGISIYPNPATDFISMALPQEVKIASLTLLDLNGRQVLQSSTSTELNISAQPAGIYFLQLTTDNGRQFIGKVVVE
jgi:hypothetical protein